MPKRAVNSMAWEVLPMAPLVSCMQLSSILGFIIRMSAWDGGEKVDFFAIASLRTDSQ